MKALSGQSDLADLNVAEKRVHNTITLATRSPHQTCKQLSDGEEMKRYQPQLGELIRELRVERGFPNQDKFAEFSGIDARTLRALETGGGVQYAKLAAVCDALDITISKLKTNAVERRRLTNIDVGNALTPRMQGARDSLSMIKNRLDEIDNDINKAFGPLIALTQTDEIVEFSSRRLVSSLSILGIPPEIVFNILEKLTETLSHFVPEGENMSTGHIRSAVAQLISELSEEEISATGVFRLRKELSKTMHGLSSPEGVSVGEIKFDWASRYARRYGNPSQIMQILEENGQAKRLDYAFIKGELIPHALRRILGDDFKIEEGGLVNPSIISEMARVSLEEFRRLGLYSIRYKTALWLTEDLAIHPPHPWVVSDNTRAATISYDFDRANANLEGLKKLKEMNDFGVKHRFSEVVHHLCSAILATYSGFLGHKQTSSINILRHWLSIQEDNPILWERCDLRFIDGDLYSCGISKQELSSMLKRIDVALNSRSRPPLTEIVNKCNKVKDIAESLNRKRNRMIYLDEVKKNDQYVDINVLKELAMEVIFSCFGARKVYRIIDKNREELIGYSATPAFDGTVLAGKQPLCLFLFSDGSENEDGYHRLCERALDQLNAHRLAETCVILSLSEPKEELYSRLRAMEEKLSGSQIIRVFDIDKLQRERRRCAGFKDFIDGIFLTM